MFYAFFTPASREKECKLLVYSTTNVVPRTVKTPGDDQASCQLKFSQLY